MTGLGKIGRRILLWFVAVALIPLVFMGWQGYTFAREAVEREVFLHMQAIAASKQLAIEQWFRERQSDLRVLVSSPQLVEALSVQRDDLHALNRVQTLLVTYLQQSESYADICLHGSKGEPLACTMNAVGFAPESTLGDLFERAIVVLDPVMSPIYARNKIGPSMHMACAVRDSSSRVLGIVVTTLSLAQTLNPIILDTTGLGQTGEAYLLDEQRVMLTPSRFMSHPDPLTHTMDSEGIRAALALKGTQSRDTRVSQRHSDTESVRFEAAANAAIYEGYDGESVLGAWAYLPEQRWALIAEIKADEAFEPLEQLKRSTIIVALITLGAILIVVWFVSQSISLPIRRLADASIAVSTGDLERRVMVDLNDELGELARRFNQMVISLGDYQRQLVRSERLAAIGELAASVVHEIRNPLSSVKMNLQILESKSAKDTVTAEQFKIAREQAGRLEKLLDEILDYAKPEALQRSETYVKEVLETAVRQASSLVPECTIETEISDPDSRISADVEKLNQVITNLILNAAQAMNGTGPIHITSSHYSENDTSHALIAVEDSGPGMTPETLARALEPFFTTRKQGTGLGLAIAKKIVEAHGGQIRICSIIGRGTRVEILLPAIPANRT